MDYEGSDGGLLNLDLTWWVLAVEAKTGEALIVLESIKLLSLFTHLNSNLIFNP